MTIHKKSNRFKALAWLSIFVAVLLTLSAIILSGCTDTLKGNINANVAPTVYFVNIPPDSSSFSHNPEVYWFGTDPDGQIEYYRYLVCTFAEGGDNRQDALAWAEASHDTSWSYIDIDPMQADPQTTHIIPLTADLQDPVRTFVDHWVFLQAFDDDGLGSVIAIKSLNRNDHPPSTNILKTMKNDTPYVDATSAGGIVTGVKLTWEGGDVQDYDEQGLIAPPFEFEWKLWGPYSLEDIDSIYSKFRSIVFFPVTQDSIYYPGDTMINVDARLVEDEEGNIDWVYDYDTVIFTTETMTNTMLGYYRDTLLATPDTTPYFDESMYLAAESWDGIDSWVWDIGDTLLNVYSHRDPSLETRIGRYLFVITSRDDALVPDPTPAYVDFPVIEPRYEKDVVVIDFTLMKDPPYSLINDKDFSMRKGLFLNMINQWNPSIVIDTSGSFNDYLLAGKYIGGVPLDKLMQYKMMIIYADHVTPSFFGNGQIGVQHPMIFTAIDAGINAWVTARGLMDGTASTPYPLGWYPPVPDEVIHYFGVEGTFNSSWAAFFNELHWFNDSTFLRMEDFVGAYSLDESQWPNLDVDTALLHARYIWWEEGNVFTASCPWIVVDTIEDTLGNIISVDTVGAVGALPEVNWCERRYGTEPMYLYKSKYGSDHPLGHPYLLEGAPVGIRYETNMFRTTWFQFTPWSINSTQMQELADNVLEWLYDPDLGAETVTEKRYPDALIKISIDEARQNFDARNEKYQSE